MSPYVVPKPPKGAQERKVSEIWTISCHNSETVRDVMSVIIIRKSHTGLRLMVRVPSSMTLNNLKRRNSPYFAFFFAEFDSFALFAGRLCHSGWRWTYYVPDLEFSRLESWSRDVSKPVFTSLRLGLGLGTSESWSWSWSWNPRVSASVLVLGLGTMKTRFLPRCMQCRRGLAMRILSVCPSVCPSVTRVICDKMEERLVQIFIPYERTFISLLWEEEWLVGDDPF